MRFSSYVSNYFNIKKYSDDYYKLTFIKHHEYKREEFFSDKLILVYDQPEFREDFKILKFDYELSERNSKVEKIGKFINNLSRAKGKVFEYAICNEFDYFITLTLDSKKYDRFNLAAYIKDLGQFIRNNRRKYSCDIQYLLIPEKHKNGAWHIHGLIKGVPDVDITLNKNGYLDWLSYSKKFGYCSLSKVKNNTAVAKYITKYISKSFNEGQGVTQKEKKLYYNSRGLKVSEKIIEGQFDNKALEKISFDFSNDYVSLKDLDKKQFLEFVGSLDF